jgi:hypothetical protein
MAYIDYYIVQYFMIVTFLHIFCQSLKFYFFLIVPTKYVLIWFQYAFIVHVPVIVSKLSKITTCYTTCYSTCYTKSSIFYYISLQVTTCYTYL